VNVQNNSCWLLGNGEKINFWHDAWCGDPLVQSFQVPETITSNLPTSVKAYITNHQWNLPPDIFNAFPQLRTFVNKIDVPISDKEDSLVWKHNSTGTLSLKEAYEFKKNQFPKLSWTSLIWSKDIPPSKSIMVWRLMLDKLPTDDNLTLRGCSFPSMCSLCFKTNETAFHLFFECPFAVNLWNWFASVINCNLQFQVKEDVWAICNKGWNPQCKIVITAAIINIFNAVWFARNQTRFNDKVSHWRSAISVIISNTSLSGNLTTKKASSAMADFSILKKFNVSIHPPNAPQIIEVIWSPPNFNWVKCNTDGSATATSSACGGIFRDKHAKFLLCFAENTSLQNAYHAELMGAMRAIELASSSNWNYLWLECDSALVVNAFKNKYLIPWKLRNR